MGEVSYWQKEGGQKKEEGKLNLDMGIADFLGWG
jgi:hypothetical protein